MINQSADLRIGIYQSGVVINKEYEERHLVTTNNFGLVELAIGKGTPISGIFSNIQWGRFPHFLKVEVNTGAGYVDLGNTQLLSVPYAFHAKNVTNDSDNQQLSIAGNTLSITGGNSITLPGQVAYTAGSGINISGTTISNTGDLSSSNEIQTISLTDQTLSLSGGGGSVNLAGVGLTLPFSKIMDGSNQTAFQIINSTPGNGIAIHGRLGLGYTGMATVSSAITGDSRQGHGVAGYSSADGGSGLLGLSNVAGGYGIRGIGSNGAVGSYFESSGTGPALATGHGNVGIGVIDPDVKLEVNGSMRVNSNVGRLEIGFPGGDKWYFSTLDGGESLVLNSQLFGASSFQSMFFNKEGRIVIGSSTPEGRLKIRHNSTATDPQLLLLQEGSGYGRFSIKNERVPTFWTIAGITQADSTQDRLNFYHSALGDILSLSGKGFVGIRTISPVADLHLVHREIKHFDVESGRLGMRLQNVGVRNNFWNLYVQNLTGNLELYFKENKRGEFNDETGIYMATSDERLKKDIRPMGAMIDAVMKLQPKRYRFLEQPSDAPETLGFLAQDVARIFPELVQHGGDGGADVFTMDHSGFGIIAIKAIQEQQQIIQTQQKTIEQLLQRLEILEKNIANLKNP